MVKKVDPQNDKPLYKQIEKYIIDKINNQELKPGKAIPPERELCKKLNVSRITVRNAIQELVHSGYLYRVQGRGTFVFGKGNVQKKTHKSIGVILDYCYKELETNMLRGIETVLEQENYSMSFKSSENDYKREAETIQRMKNEGVEGLIILPAEDQEDSTAIHDLKNEQFPLVLIDRRLQGCETDCVMSDNKHGSYLATEYLLQLGHEKIGFIKSEFTKTSSIEDRISGYQHALFEYGIEYDPELMLSFDSSLEKQEKDEKLFQLVTEKGLTAVLAVNDYIALDIIKMCREKNIKIPSDLSIIGFDNLDVSTHLEVPLTTVAQFPRKIGYEAAKLLIEKINTTEEIKRKKIHQIYYPVDLIVRDSCKRLN